MAKDTALQLQRCSSSPTVSTSTNTANHKKRSYSVRFAPLPPPHNPKTIIHELRGFRHDYNLGDTVRECKHMVVLSPEQAYHSINALKKHDFAFVKRPDGTFAYAILAFRSLEPADDQSNTAHSLEEYMGFVTCGAGSIQMLKKSQWSECVRLVSADGLDPLPSSTCVKARRQGFTEKDTDDDWMPPNLIAFVPTAD